MVTSLFTFFCPSPWPVRITIEKLRKLTNTVRVWNVMKKSLWSYWGLNPRYVYHDTGPLAMLYSTKPWVAQIQFLGPYLLSWINLALFHWCNFKKSCTQVWNLPLWMDLQTKISLAYSVCTEMILIRRLTIQHKHNSKTAIKYK